MNIRKLWRKLTRKRRQRNRRRVIISLRSEAHDVGCKLALHHNRNFSGLMETLIAQEAQRVFNVQTKPEAAA